MGLLAVIIILYFLPASVAFLRRHAETRQILIGNLFLGWTGLGWLWFLALAANPRAARRFLRLDGPAPATALPWDAAEIEEGLQGVARESLALQAPARRAAAQLHAVHSLVAKLTAILDRKLSPGELTYSRYKGGAELLREAVIGNLGVILSLLRSLEPIETTRVISRLQELRKARTLSAAETEERRALEAREALAASQHQKTAVLLGRNESAITELAKLAGTLAETNMLPGRAAVSLDSALQQLEKLAAQLKLYEQNPIELNEITNERDDR